MKLIEGNLFDHFENKVEPHVDVIAHVCNCQGVMGSGIALSIKHKYPRAYEVYKNQDMWRLGDITLACVARNKSVVNMQAQYEYGTEPRRFLNYESLYMALEATAKMMTSQKLVTLGVPYLMGCDRARGSWRVVSAMLEDIEEKAGIEIIAVKLK